MKRIKTGLTGFILGDWLGMPYRGKGKGTFITVTISTPDFYGVSQDTQMICHSFRATRTCPC